MASIGGLHPVHRTECCARCMKNELTGLLEIIECFQSESTTQEKVDTVDRFIEDRKDLVRMQMLHRVRRWLVRMCEARDILPRSLFVRGRVVFSENPPLQNGATSDVRRGFHFGKSQGRVAIKCARMHQDSVRKKFIKEAMIMRALAHPNITPFVGVLEEPHRLCILTKWMQNGTVMEYLSKNPNASRDAMVCQIAQGLHYLEISGVIHGDIKGDNILVDEKHNIRIADFGNARFIADRPSLHEQVIDVIAPTMKNHVFIPASSTSTGGTYRWLAPELIAPTDGHSVHPTHASDIFSLSMVIYQIYSERVPLHHIQRPITAALKMRDGERPVERPSNMPGLIWQLAQKCWAQDPAQRPTTREVCNFLFCGPLMRGYALEDVR